MTLKSIIILAGRRAGATDPLAERFGVADKCLVPVAGRPMIAHVLSAAAQSSAERIVVSSHDFDVLAKIDDPIVAQLGKRLVVRAASDNLADSVLLAAEALPFPMLITTADNCLLTPATMAEIAGAASDAGADAAVALARREDVQAAHPIGQRRFYEFTDVAVSNCNAYWIGTRRALAASEVFRGGGQFVKKPVRVMYAFGFINLLRFRFGLGPIHHVFAKLSRRMKLCLVPVLVSDGASAIDVDNDRSLAVTEDLIAQRRATTLLETAAADSGWHRAAA